MNISADDVGSSSSAIDDIQLHSLSPIGLMALATDIVSGAIPPTDIVPGTQQPKDAISKYTWIIRKVGANNVYQCKLCNNRFTGQKCLVGTHFEPSFSNQRIRACRGEIPQDLKDAIFNSMKETGESSAFSSYSHYSESFLSLTSIELIFIALALEKKNNKRGFAAIAGSAIVDKSETARLSSIADAAILQFFACEGFPPSTGDKLSFRAMIKAVCAAGPHYLASDIDSNERLSLS